MKHANIIYIATYHPREKVPLSFLGHEQYLAHDFTAVYGRGYAGPNNPPRGWALLTFMSGLINAAVLLSDATSIQSWRSGSGPLRPAWLRGLRMFRCGQIFSDEASGRRARISQKGRP